ncbi:MAG TPA: hypothetical protein VJW95_02515 [Dissulfurispiraceae bacterium]|nr:hypothetical protein [Dissulfurispiraceae bacterium]
MKEVQQGKTAVPPVKKVGMTSKELISGPAEAVASHKVETINIIKKGAITMEEKRGFANFDAQNVNENVLKMTKFSLDKTFDSIAKVQEFNDKIIKDSIKTTRQIQADTEKLMGEWIEEGKKGWDEYRKVMEEGYKKFETLIVP